MSSILLYQTDQGKVHVEVRFKDETFWLTQKMMAELFQCSTDNISLHLKNIFSTKELAQDSVTEESSATANDGKSYRTKFYNLDAVIAVGVGGFHQQHRTRVFPQVLDQGGIHLSPTGLYEVEHRMPLHPGTVVVRRDQRVPKQQITASTATG